MGRYVPCKLGRFDFLGLLGPRMQASPQALLTVCPLYSGSCTEAPSRNPALISQSSSLFLQFPRFLSFFFSWVSNTQFNHWTKRVLRTKLSAQDLRNCPGLLPTRFPPGCQCNLFLLVPFFWGKKKKIVCNFKHQIVSQPRTSLLSVY